MHNGIAQVAANHNPIRLQFPRILCEHLFRGSRNEPCELPLGILALSASRKESELSTHPRGVRQS